MSWFDSIFSGLSDLFGSGNASVADAMMGGTTDIGALDGASSIADSVAQTGGDWGFGDAARSAADAARSASGGFDVRAGDTPFFDPNSVGRPPAVDSATVGSVGNAGSSVVGALGSGNPDDSTIADTAPATAWESRQAPWYNAPGPAGADVTRSAGSPFYSSTPGVSGMASPDASIASAPPVVPTFTDKLGNWWDKTSTSLANAPGEAADAFAKAPIATTAKIATTLAPFVVSGIQASQQADAARQAAREYRRTMPGPVAVNPLPGTTGISQADIPAGSPMSPLASPQGGFTVGPNRGLARPVGLRDGGIVGQDQPIMSAQAAAILDYLKRLDQMGR